MDSSEDLSLTSFRIVYNNQLLEINYDSSFEEYKTQTINSLIQKVLEKFGPKPLNNSNKNYILLCSCGKAFEPEQLLCKSKCDHYKYFDETKNKNEKFLLIEKDKENNIKENKNSSLLTNYEISEILMKATGAKKIKNVKVVPENKSINFQISENLKAKIKELQLKKEKYTNLINRGYIPRYNEQYYQEFLEMGMEYSNISNEEIASRTKLIIKNINKKNNEDESDDINESGEGYDSSSFEQEESEDDDIISMEFPFSNENSSEA